ncbi:hypothetical protein JCM17845_03640 [Iodidimonas gelatinilytica]|uniref:HpcH/HpaI aldolase/citrate lyase domain-containing protein n=1 Tax=Iodidimonas gelatinilytica TaxID=1236966 RepID=A0A5A7MUQ7_9PROT|nr:hypothetical protein JCM17845_03640 [Iodidimonas gelatinilytica]
MKKLGYDRETAIWAMMETPRGILAADRIAAGTDRLACFVMGTNDLAKDLRLAPTPAREGFATSFGLALLAARAFGLAILDGVYGDLQDAEGFEQECRQGVMLGFDGKTLVHPKQIGPANDLFRPSADAIAHATRMLAAWKDAEAQGKGVATLDGKMIEHLHIQDAQRLLALDHAIKTRG